MIAKAQAIGGNFKDIWNKMFLNESYLKYSTLITNFINALIIIGVIYSLFTNNPMFIYYPLAILNIYLIQKNFKEFKTKERADLLKPYLININLLINVTIINLFLIIVQLSYNYLIVIGYIIAIGIFYLLLSRNPIYRLKLSRTLDYDIADDIIVEWQTIKVPKIKKIYNKETKSYEARRIAGKFTMEKVAKLAADDIILGKLEGDDRPIIQYKNDSYTHTLCVGATGTGKSALFFLPILRQMIHNENISLIVVEPKGDLAKEVYALYKYHRALSFKKQQDEIINDSYISDEEKEEKLKSLKNNFQYRKCTLFDPSHPACHYFNPMIGDEDEVVNLINDSYLKSKTGQTTQYFLDLSSKILKNAIKAAKRARQDKATFLDVKNLITLEGDWETTLDLIENTGLSDIEKQENNSISRYFKDDYNPRSERNAARGSKEYTDSSDLRTFMDKVTSSSYLKNVFMPGWGNDLKGRQNLDIKSVIENKEILSITSSDGELGEEASKFLGYLLILNIQNQIFNRPGNPNTRHGVKLLIDEFQVYVNKSMEKLLNQGRSYCVSLYLATQNLSAINIDKEFFGIIMGNTRTKIVFPGVNPEDEKYFKSLFGTRTKPEYELNRTKVGQITSLKDGGSDNYTLNDKPKENIVDFNFKHPNSAIISTLQHRAVKRPVEARLEFIPKAIKTYLDSEIKKYDINKEELERSLNLGTLDKDTDEIYELPLINYFSGDDINISKRNKNNNFNNSNELDDIEDSNKYDEEEVVLTSQSLDELFASDKTDDDANKILEQDIMDSEEDDEQELAKNIKDEMDKAKEQDEYNRSLEQDVMDSEEDDSLLYTDEEEFLMFDEDDDDNRY